VSEHDATPHPPSTAEFGFVEPGGRSHVYDEHDGMAVTKFSVGPFDNNVYVVRCTATGKAIIVDGAADAERILGEAEGTEVVGIVQTHGHPDHIQALEALVGALDVPVFAHPADKMPVATTALSDGHTLKVGALEIAVMHTPGHTPGGICFVVNDHLFSGDTLFPGGPGNTFGKRAAFDQIMGSLDRLFALPDQTRVSPGHGLDTTLARERPYLETWRARGW
jgi:glyoxylase-like metal-dependent hydrolase (beta-lactamase superfamily II)